LLFFAELLLLDERNELDETILDDEQLKLLLLFFNDWEEGDET